MLQQACSMLQHYLGMYQATLLYAPEASHFGQEAPPPGSLRGAHDFVETLDIAVSAYRCLFCSPYRSSAHRAAALGSVDYSCREMLPLQYGLSVAPGTSTNSVRTVHIQLPQYELFHALLPGVTLPRSRASRYRKYRTGIGVSQVSHFPPSSSTSGE